MIIRPATRSDAADWERLRHALWPDSSASHAQSIERYWTSERREPLEVLLAFDSEDNAIGFIELSIRAYAEGCSTDRVAFVEGWYVDAQARGNGVGAALIRAAEDWARDQGCIELGSDADVDNTASAAAHRAVGFVQTAIIRCFLKSL